MAGGAAAATPMVATATAAATATTPMVAAATAAATATTPMVATATAAATATLRWLWLLAAMGPTAATATAANRDTGNGPSAGIRPPRKRPFAGHPTSAQPRPGGPVAPLSHALLRRQALSVASL